MEVAALAAQYPGEVFAHTTKTATYEQYSATL